VTGSDAPRWARHLPAPVGWRDVDLLAGRSIPRVAAGWAATQPDRPAVGPLSWGDLLERSAIVAGRLAGLGLRPGDRLLCSAPPSVDLVVAHLAALRMGLVVVPANTAYGPAELAHIVGDAGPAAAVLDDAARVRGSRRSDPRSRSTTGRSRASTRPTRPTRPSSATRRGRPDGPRARS